MILYWIAAAAVSLVAGAIISKKMHDLKAGDQLQCALGDFKNALPQLSDISRMLNGFIPVTVVSTDEATNTISGTVVVPGTGVKMPVQVKWVPHMAATRNGKTFSANGPLHLLTSSAPATAAPGTLPLPTNPTLPGTAPTPAFPQGSIVPGAAFPGASALPGLAVPGIVTMAQQQAPGGTPEQIAALANQLQGQVLGALNTDAGARVPEQNALLLQVGQLSPGALLDVLKAGAISGLAQQDVG